MGVFLVPYISLKLWNAPLESLEHSALQPQGRYCEIGSGQVLWRSGCRLDLSFCYLL